MKGLNTDRVLGGGICAGVLLALGETFLNQTVLAIRECHVVDGSNRCIGARKAPSSRAAGAGSGVGSRRQRHYARRARPRCVHGAGQRRPCCSDRGANPLAPVVRRL